VSSSFPISCSQRAFHPRASSVAFIVCSSLWTCQDTIGPCRGRNSRSRLTSSHFVTPAIAGLDIAKHVNGCRIVVSNDRASLWLLGIGSACLCEPITDSLLMLVNHHFPHQNLSLQPRRPYRAVCSAKVSKFLILTSRIYTAWFWFSINPPSSALRLPSRPK